jgi:hypothetical protein
MKTPKRSGKFVIRSLTTQEEIEKRGGWSVGTFQRPPSPSMPESKPKATPDRDMRREVRHSMSIAIAIPHDQLYTVLEVAKDGAIQYWVDDRSEFINVVFKRPDNQNRVVLLGFDSVKDHKHYTVGAQELAIAYAKIVQGDGKATVRHDLRRMVAALPFEEVIDPEVADVLVQVAAFGEVLYG